MTWSTHKNGNNEKYTDLLNTCKICGEKWFATQLQLETHLSEKHGIGSIQCSQCEYRAIDILLLPNHYRKLVIHERQCGKKRFLPKTRSGGIFRCGPCRLSFDSRSKKIQHILQQHRDLYENYKKKNAIYRVSHLKLCKVILLWWVYTFDFLLVLEVLCIAEKPHFLPL